MFSVPPERETPGVFAFDAESDPEVELEDELSYWSRAQLDAFQKAVGAGLGRYPWAMAQRVPGKSPLEIARLTLKLDAILHETSLPRPKRAREALEMPRLWNTKIEDQSFPSDLVPITTQPKQQDAEPLLFEDAVKAVLQKSILGDKMMLHPEFMGSVHEILISHVRQVASLAALVCNERNRSRGTRSQDSVTSNDVRLACMILMNEDPLVGEAARAEEAGAGAEGADGAPPSPQEQSLRLSDGD